MTTMKGTSAIIIGGGQAGLAMSRILGDRAIDHVVLERGRVAERWRSERWDSLRLLTPNWQSRLPGWGYRGNDPDGYMTVPELVDFLEGYARSFSAPIEAETTVLAVEAGGRGYRVTTDRGTWTAPNVVVATGHCGWPRVPGFSSELSGGIHQLAPADYRNPDQLAGGGVLVVGASASGIQLADEIHRSGRPVTLAVGRHTRLPRLHRGRDIMWWLDTVGILDETVDPGAGFEATRSQVSLQLVGRPDRSTLDLSVLRNRGVRLVGRAVAGEGTAVRFADDLAASTAAADFRLARLLARIDGFIADAGLDRDLPEAEPVNPVRPGPAPTALDLAAEGIRTVVWATGFGRSYPWLTLPVLDGRGEIVHRGGITPAPGLYVLGLSLQRRRKSTYIDGVGSDALEIADEIAARLEVSRPAAA
jgi:putative flavoprotein involved in K+ transport